MARIKLTKEIKYIICDIIAEELYNMHIKDKMINIKNMQQNFIKQAKKEYFKTFEFTDEIIKFCEKHNLGDSNRLYFDCCYSKYSATDRTLFKSDNGFNSDYTTQSNYSVEFRFPLYYKLNYIYINNNQETFHNKIYSDYEKFMFPAVKEISDISKIIKNDYIQFREVVFGCNYVDEIKKFIPFKSVKEFLDKKYVSKLSTDLCTINNEKIDFVKNYLKNKK